uniref:Uncharacterized protein n=1 Tax=Physcomitrium patens TaxID=3218 RepID=A0A2K1KIL8_PHYPA|nr:hypothetical protein PHYPA_007295 [Physcomitrium patens]
MAESPLKKIEDNLLVNGVRLDHTRNCTLELVAAAAAVKDVLLSLPDKKAWFTIVNCYLAFLGHP